MIVDANFDNFSELTQDGFCIVDFFSDSCGPCKMLAAHLNRVESEFPFIKVVRVNTSTYPEFSSRYEIGAVPTIFFMNEGEMKERHLGVLDEDELKERISKYMYE